jgi:hypothetical protein
VHRFGTRLPSDLVDFAARMADVRMRRIRTVSPYAA